MRHGRKLENNENIGVIKLLMVLGTDREQRKKESKEIHR